MNLIHRKTNPGVVRGTVQKKNRTSISPNYFDHWQPHLVVDRKKPGAGYRHILKKADVLRFIALLPDWETLSAGLNAIVLDSGTDHCDGWYLPGVVAVCAWHRDLWAESGVDFYLEHREVLEQIGVPCEIREDHVLCKWTEATICAYQLTHILLHELGHHHDRMTTKSQRDSCRGEPFAEQYAVAYADQIWEAYLKEFGLP